MAASVFSATAFTTPMSRFIVVITLQMNAISLHTYKLVHGSLEFPYYVDATHLLLSIIFAVFGVYGLGVTELKYGYLSVPTIIKLIIFVAVNHSTLELWYHTIQRDKNVHVKFIKTF